MQNALYWFEIPAEDINRAKKFYEAIFGFKMEEFKTDTFTMMIFPSKGEVGGAIIHSGDFYKPSSEGTLVYLNADPDLQSVQDKVEQNGGKIIIPKRMISDDRGYMAVFIDSEGNRVALHSNK